MYYFAAEKAKIKINFTRNGEPGGTRTRDHRIKSAMLYQLSYRPALDSNFRIASGFAGIPRFACSRVARNGITECAA